MDSTDDERIENIETPLDSCPSYIKISRISTCSVIRLDSDAYPFINDQTYTASYKRAGRGSRAPRRRAKKNLYFERLRDANELVT